MDELILDEAFETLVCPNCEQSPSDCVCDIDPTKIKKGPGLDTV